MCGIVGYIGSKKNGIEAVIGGLQTLEYRGYDSAGISFLVSKHAAHVVKQVGQVKNPPLATSAVSLHRGQAGVPSTQEGRVVVGKIAIQPPFSSVNCEGRRPKKPEDAG